MSNVCKMVSDSIKKLTPYQRRKLKRQMLIEGNEFVDKLVPKQKLKGVCVSFNGEIINGENKL